MCASGHVVLSCYLLINHNMGLKASHQLRCLPSEPRAAQRRVRHGAALPYHEKYRDLFFMLFHTEMKKLKPFKCSVEKKPQFCEYLSCQVKIFQQKNFSSESSQPALRSRSQQLSFKCIIFLHIRVVSQAPRKQGA